MLGLISQMRERKRQFYESFDITLLENIKKVKKLVFFFFHKKFLKIFTKPMLLRGVWFTVMLHCAVILCYNNLTLM